MGQGEETEHSHSLVVPHSPTCLECLREDIKNLEAIAQAARNEADQIRAQSAEYHKLSEIQFEVMRQQMAKLKKERDEARRDTAVPGMYALGYALFYFKYCHPEIDWGEQPERVHQLCLRQRALRERECAPYIERAQKGEEITDEEHEEITKRFQPEWEQLLKDIEEETDNLC